MIEFKKGDVIKTHRTAFTVVDGPIESGNTSKIYKVHHPEWDTYLSMKVPRDELIRSAGGKEAFLKECELWAQLGAHPYIVNCAFATEYEGTPLLFCEWCEGKSLKELIDSGSLYEGSEVTVVQRIMKISIQVLTALCFAHSYGDGVIHKDVKPGNIIISRDGNAKLTDFGSAGDINNSATLEYVSPEQYALISGMSQTPLTSATDFYSWVLVTLEMFTGRRVWDCGREAAHVYDEIINAFKIQPSVREINIYRRCLCAEPDNRPEEIGFLQKLCRVYSRLPEIKPFSEIRRYLSSDYETPDSLNNKALSLLELGNTKKAIECWNRALDIHPAHPESLYNRSLTMWEKGQLCSSDLIAIIDSVDEPERSVFIDEYTKNIESVRRFIVDGLDDLMPELIEFNKSGQKLFIKYSARDATDNTKKYEVYESSDFINEEPRLIESGDDPDGFLERSEDTWKAVDEQCCPYNIKHDFMSMTLSLKGIRKCRINIDMADNPCAISSDGRYFAYTCEIGQCCDVIVYRIPELDGYKMHISRTAQTEDISQELEDFYMYKNAILSIDDTVKRKVNFLSKIKEIKHLGSSREYYKIRDLLVPYCEITNINSIMGLRSYTHTDEISSADISPDGRFIITCHYNGGQPVWILTEVDTGRKRKFEPEDYYFPSDVVFINNRYLELYYANLIEDKSDYILVFDTQQWEIRGKRKLKESFAVHKAKAAPKPKLPDFVKAYCQNNRFDFCCLNTALTYLYCFKKSGEQFIVNLDRPMIPKTGFEDMIIKANSDSADGKEQDDMAKKEKAVVDNTDSDEFDNNNKDKNFDDDIMKAIIDDDTDGPVEEEYDDDDNEEEYEPDDADDPESFDGNLENVKTFIDKVENMRRNMLETIKGQDHAIHTFCDGYLSSMLLADKKKANSKNRPSDRNERPRAVFTFAGPPGVGKTLLAQLAAQSIGDMSLLDLDMTQYSGHEDSKLLIGSNYLYHGSTPGKLTLFVHQHPRSIIIFDEVEKAHIDALHTLYSILDTGVTYDVYHRSCEEPVKERPVDKQLLKNKGRVSFKDTILIFTTNAGFSIYENPKIENNALVSAKTLLSALETEKNYLTGNSFFPTALVSRIASGYPILFNNLKAYDLLPIVKSGFIKTADKFKEKYDLSITAEEDVYTALLFSNGGKSDARSLAANTAKFVKDEMRAAFYALDDITAYKNYKFSCVGYSRMAENVRALFINENKAVKQNILIYCSKNIYEKLSDKYPQYCFIHADTSEKALVLAGKKDFAFALLDIAYFNISADRGGERDAMTSYGSMAQTRIKEGRELFGTLTERISDLPVYLLELPEMPYNDALLENFIRAGAKGKLTLPAEETVITDDDADTEVRPASEDSFGKELERLCRYVNMLESAHTLASSHKILSFDTALKPDKSTGTVTIELRNLILRSAPNAADSGDLLSLGEIPNDRFSDIIGNDDAIKALSRIRDFLSAPRQYLAKGYPVPKGVLLYGPKGTGKTMLARATAGESGVSFIATQGSKLTSGQEVSRLFANARRNAPAIIFIDEVDAVAMQRKGGSTAALNTLLVEMDGFTQQSTKLPVAVIAATNASIGGEDYDSTVGQLDDAFIRRFSETIYVDVPNTEERKALIKMYLDKLLNEKGKDVSEKDIDSFAERTNGFSPDEIKTMIGLANNDALDAGEPISSKHIEEKLQEKMSGKKHDMANEEALKLTAQHECGHSIVYIDNGFVPSYINLEPRGNFAGYMQHSESEIKSRVGFKDELLGHIRVALGGRAAELVCGGENGARMGASQDLHKATLIAADMICHYGMYADEYGLMSTGKESLSNPKIAVIINRILKDELEKAKEVIVRRRDEFDKLTEALLDKHRLYDKDIRELLGIPDDKE